MVFKKIFLILSGIFITLHFYLFSLMLKPYMGINISNNSSGDYIITHINKNDGWVRYTAVLPGDIISKVDGQPISDVSINRGSELEITDGEFTQMFAIPNFETRHTLQELIIPSIFSILALVFSILMVKSPNAVNRYFIGFLLSAALSLFASTESGRDDIIANIIIAIFLPLGSLFLVLFIFALLHDRGIIQQQSSMWFKFNTVICITVILIRLFDLLYKGKGHISAISANLILFYFCANVFFVILSLCYYYIKNISHEGRNILKWLLWINILAFTPFIFLHALPYILDLPYLDDDAVEIFLFIIPIGYFYLAVSKQLIDLNFILNQIPYYFLLSLLPAISLATIIISGNSNPNSKILYFFLLIFVTASIIVILFFIKEKVDFILRHRLWMRNDSLSQQLEFFIQKLSSSMKENDLKNLFISQLQEALAPSIVAFIAFDYLKDDFQLEEISRDEQAIHLSEKFKDMMRNHKKIDLLEYQGLLGMRIHTIESTHTYIWIGYKKNQTVFNLHEKVWFINIVKYLRLVYENIFAVENLIHSIEQTKHQQTQSSSTLSRFLFQLSEQERKRLAADLHDSALQDQIIWYRTLEKLIATNPNLSLETMEQLNQIKTGMQDVIQQIRTTCNELRPALITEVGLVSALEALCEKTQMKAGFDIKYDFPSIIEHNDYNLEVCIYRVIQELLNNAYKHSNASLVSLSLWEDEKQIYLDYRDDGVGFTTTATINNTHTGLTGIKERIYSFKGHIVFLTEVSHGVEIHITIPRWNN